LHSLSPPLLLLPTLSEILSETPKLFFYVRLIGRMQWMDIGIVRWPVCAGLRQEAVELFANIAREQDPGLVSSK